MYGLTSQQGAEPVAPDDRDEVPLAGMLFAAFGVVVTLAIVLVPVATDPVGLALGHYGSTAPDQLLAYAQALGELADGGPWSVPGSASHTVNLAGTATLLGAPWYWLAGGGLSGAVLAWNAQVVVALLLGAAGTWVLVRTLLPDDPWGATAGGVTAAFATGAFVIQAPDVGRLDSLALLLVPLPLGLLARAALRGVGGLGIVAGLALALCTATGALPAFFAWTAVALCGAWWVLVAEEKGPAIAATVVTLVIGGAGAAPWAMAAAAHPEVAAALDGAYPLSTPVAAILPGGGAEPFAWGAHARPYPSWTLVLAAAAGAVVSGRARFWFLATLAALLFALGPGIYWRAGEAGIVQTPLGLVLSVMPDSVPRSGWSQLGAFLPLLPAIGAAWLLASRPRASALIFLLAIGEQLWFSVEGMTWPRAWEVRPPEVLVSWSKRAPTLHLPHDASLELWAEDDDGSVFTRVSAPPEGVPLLVYLQAMLPGGRRLLEQPPPEGTISRSCVAAGAHELRHAGILGLAVRVGRVDAVRSVRTVVLLTAGLGRPAFEDGKVFLWDLREAPDAVCSDADRRIVAPPDATSPKQAPAEVDAPGQETAGHPG